MKFFSKVLFDFSFIKNSLKILLKSVSYIFGFLLVFHKYEKKVKEK